MGQYTIRINERTTAGKSLLSFLKTLKGVVELEKLEDPLLDSMKANRNNKLLSKKEKNDFIAELKTTR